MMSRPGTGVNLGHWAALCLLDVLFHWLNRTRILGKENIPAPGERGVLILCNHISALDPLLIGAAAMPRFSPVWWRAAAKEELFTSPWTRWIVRFIGGFPVRRGEHDEASMQRMADCLQLDVLVVFPEGTWSKTGELLPGRSGVGEVIFRARPSKIIPVAVKGIDRMLPRQAIVPRIGKRAAIVFGPPMDLSRFYIREESQETYRAIVDAVMGEIGRLYRSL